MTKPTMKVTSDFTKDLNDIVKHLRRDEVLVGIPDNAAARDNTNGEKSQISNAALLFINNFGSPAQNIPPRPVMEIGIKNAQEQIAQQFKLALQKALTKGRSALSTYYNRAGLIASNSVKKAINAQEGFPGPAESTLRDRRARGFMGTKALIVTAQMRNAITYTIAGEDR